jgi:hypothetical protein
VRERVCAHVQVMKWDWSDLCCIWDEMGRNCAVSEMRWVGVVLYLRWDGSDLCCIWDEMGRICAVLEIRWVGLLLYQRWNGPDLCCVRWDGSDFYCIRDEMGRICAASEIRRAELCYARDKISRTRIQHEIKWSGPVLHTRSDVPDVKWDWSNAHCTRCCELEVHYDTHQLRK